MSDTPQGPGWWQASDGRYYPPQGQAVASAPKGPPQRRGLSRGCLTGLVVGGVILGLLVVLGLIVGPEDDDKKVSSSATTTTEQKTGAASATTTPPTNAPDVCLPVGAALRGSLQVPSKLAAVKATDRARAWYVASAEGGTWLTNVDPAVPDDLGLTLPLNNVARAQSEIGTAAQKDAPILQGATTNDAEAELARECARR